MEPLLILGAKSDMAWATAQKFASEKHPIILAGRDIDALKIMQTDLIIRFEVEVEVVYFDALDINSHVTFFENLTVKPQIISCFFGLMLDQQVAEKDFASAQAIISTNYTGAVSILNCATQYLITSGTGCIIGVSSVAGERGRMSNFIYGSAKAGFTAYLSGLRNKLSHYKIHVLTVKPGFVNTSMTAELPLPKLLTAEPEEVAKDIYKGWKNKKNTIYTKWFWRYIMLIIKLIPEPVFKKLKL